MARTTSMRTMSRARWRTWNAFRRRSPAAGTMSPQTRAARSCSPSAWKRFAGSASPSDRTARNEERFRAGILPRIMKSAITTMLWGAVAVSASAGAQHLLVANQGDATVSILDATTGQRVAVVAENTPGVHGHELVATTDGRTAFLPIYGSTGVGKPGIDGHEMLMIDVPSHTVIGHVEFGHGVRPHLPVLDAKRNLLYVTTELDQAITVIDPKTRAIVGKVPTGAAESHMLVL